MDFEKLIKGTDSCPCGRSHHCDLKAVKISSGAISSIPELLSGVGKVLLVADNNTWKAAGERVEKVLKAASLPFDIFIFDTEGVLVPNETSINELSDHVCDDINALVGIGSGVINDLCKFVSFEKKLPYMIVATAPSMDGFASVGAAMITNRMKVTYTTHTPAWIVGDVEVLKNAPADMIRAGYGDVIGKCSCLNDWKLGVLLFNEYFCQYVYDLVAEMMNKTVALASGLMAGNEESIQALMEALVGVGIALAYVGNSRPASGSEHHFAHYFEITGLLTGKPYLLHGTDVAYSTYVTEALREELIAMESAPEFPEFKRTEWEAKIRELYPGASDAVMELQAKLGWHDRDLSALYTEKWQEIRKLLSEVPSCSEYEKQLEAVGLHLSDFYAFYGYDKIEDGKLFAKELKDRYTVLWLYDAVKGF